MPAYSIQRITLDTVSWTPVTAPFNCTQCSIENPGSAVIKARTSSGDSATERDIPIDGGSLVISSQTGSFATAFSTGEVICYLQAASGTGSQPTFSGNALGTHSHGAGTYAPSAHAGTAVADHASHTHTYTEIVQHTHTVNITDNGHTHVITSQTATTGGATSYEHGTLDTSSAEAEATEVTASAVTGITATTSNPAGSVATGTTAGPSATLTHSVTQPSAHTMSGSSEAVSGGTPAGTVTQPTFTGNATSVVQPYIVVTMWKRTA